MRYVRGLISPEVLQLNTQIRKHFKKTTEKSIAKCSDTINIGRQNDANLKNLEDKEIPRDEWSLPDSTLDIDCITEYLTKGVSRSDSRGCDSAKDNERNVWWSHFKQIVRYSI